MQSQSSFQYADEYGAYMSNPTILQNKLKNSHNLKSEDGYSLNDMESRNDMNKFLSGEANLRDEPPDQVKVENVDEGNKNETMESSITQITAIL